MRITQLLSSLCLCILLSNAVGEETVGSESWTPTTQNEHDMSKTIKRRRLDPASNVFKEGKKKIFGRSPVSNLPQKGRPSSNVPTTGAPIYSSGPTPQPNPSPPSINAPVFNTDGSNGNGIDGSGDDDDDDDDDDNDGGGGPTVPQAPSSPTPPTLAPNNIDAYSDGSNPSSGSGDSPTEGGSPTVRQDTNFDTAGTSDDKEAQGEKDNDGDDKDNDRQGLIVALWCIIGLCSLLICCLCCFFCAAGAGRRRKKDKKEEKEKGAEEGELDHTILDNSSILTEDTAILNALEADFALGAVARQANANVNNNNESSDGSDSSPSFSSLGDSSLSLSPPRTPPSIHRGRRFRRGRDNVGEEDATREQVISPLHDDHLGDFDQIPPQDETPELDPIFSSAQKDAAISPILVDARDPIFRTFDDREGGSRSIKISSVEDKEVEPPEIPQRSLPRQDSFIYASIDEGGAVQVQEVSAEEVLDALLTMPVPEETASVLRSRSASFESYGRYRDSLRASIQDRSQSWEAPASNVEVSDPKTTI